MSINDIQKLLVDAGAKPVHIDAFWRNWIQLRTGSNRQPLFPKKVSKLVASLQEELDLACAVKEEQISSTGTKLALNLTDDQIIEMVLLPEESACISTQVGCAVGCVFCATGTTGLIRQLTDLEIIAQVRLARKYQKIRKVVLMGMGEPSHNLRNVMSAVNFLAKYSGIGWKEIVVSTIGDSRLFEILLANPVKPALAISLHSMFDEKRRKLVPHAKMKVVELLEKSSQYAKAGKYPIQFQWTLIKGINDGEDEVEKIVELWAGRYAVLNMIPVNETAEGPFSRPSTERMLEIEKRLRGAGILLKYRNSAAQEVHGGCGQLRLHTLRKKPIAEISE